MVKEQIVHLHNHSYYSLLDGYSSPIEYLQRAKELGCSAFAITEHGNEYSWVYFDKLKEKYPDIKMIFGVEFYEAFDMSVSDTENKYFHLLALAKNEKGRIAINELITKGEFEGFYYHGRVDLNAMKSYGKDLIISSACLASKLAREADFNKCIEYVNEYKSVFPHFYLEMQSHDTIEQREYNKKIIELAKATNTEFIVTCDSHASTKEDLYYQEYLVKIAHDKDTLGETYKDCYMQSPEEIHNIMDKQIGRENVSLAMANTVKIANMIDEVHMPFQKPQLPTFPIPKGYKDNYEYLVKLCEDGFKQRGLDKLSADEQKIYRDRLEYELSVIHQMGFDGYFLIVWDLINFAKSNDIAVGDGRGCFVKGSKVLLDNGYVKNIEDVKIDDKVITHLGNVKPVQNVFEYDCDELMYELKSSDTNPIRCTNNHEILAVKSVECIKYKKAKRKDKTRRYCSKDCTKYLTCKFKQENWAPSWIQAKDLAVGDFICYPKKRVNNSNSNSMQTIDIVNFVKNVDYNNDYVWCKHNGSRSMIKRFIPLNESFFFLAGLYISQGWVHFKNGNVIGIGISHHSCKKDLINKTANLLQEFFGRKACLRFDEKKKAVQININSVIVGELMLSLFGEGASNKHIPNFLFDLQKMYRRALIYGLWSGDGCFKIGNSKKTKYSTINYNLAKQLQLLLALENIKSNINIRHHKSNANWSDEVSVQVLDRESLSILDNICKGSFNLGYKKYSKKGYCLSYQDGQYVYHRIREINTFCYKGKVYDLSVKDDTSYVVESVAVHNSGAGSIVNWLLHISTLNPIKHNLIFERFLNPERVSMPDIDTDFNKRDEVIRYLMDKYGKDNVCQIINFNFITPCVAIKDVGKVLGVPYKVTDKISKKFVYENFQENLDNDKTIIEEYAQYTDLFDIASHLSGRVKTVSMHAGGVGIVDTKITDYMAMRCGKDNARVISVDKRVIEEIGIIKFDLLGVATLSVVDDSVKQSHLNLDYFNASNEDFINDKATYELLASGRTDGVFQVESQGMKDILVKLKPTNIDDISAVLALYRPDSMGALNDYIQCKCGEKQAEYIHEDMKPILESTYGCMIYQEQMLDIVRKFGGRSYGRADLFRKAVGKKSVELVKQESAKLYQEIIGNGYSEEIAKKISDDLSTKGGYLFNKSHSVSYSMLTFKTAYLKAHYPLEFFTALLNKNKGDYGAINKYILDAKSFGVSILPPHINKSEVNFSVNDNAIIFGLSAINGIGDKFANEIVEERSSGGKFTNLNNFNARVSTNKSQIIALIKSGAFPCNDREKMLKRYFKSLIPHKEYTPVTTLPKLSVLNEMGIDTNLIKTKEERLSKYNIRKKVMFEIEQEKKEQKAFDTYMDKYNKDKDFWEFEMLSVFLTDNPFKEGVQFCNTDYAQIENDCLCTLIGVISKVQKKKDRYKNQYAYVNLYSTNGIIELTIWSSIFKKYTDFIKRGEKIAVLCCKRSNDCCEVQAVKSYDRWLYLKKNGGNTINGN